jgi:hypothetical protein
MIKNLFNRVYKIRFGTVPDGSEPKRLNGSGV